MKPNLIDRFLVSAEQRDVRAIICVNKCDLVDEVAISFAGTSRYLGGKGRWTGNPLRGEFRRPIEIRQADGPTVVYRKGDIRYLEE